MLRFRTISGGDGVLDLVTVFHPDPQSDDLTEFSSAVKISFNPYLGKEVLKVLSHGDAPFPPLYNIAEEIDYLLNLLKSLNYDPFTSSPVSSDFPPLSDK